MSKILGIDLGTSSVKVGVVDAATLKVVALGSAEYPIHHPKPDFAEQDPEQWWQATVRAVHAALQSVDKHDIVAIGLSGHMHGMVFIGQDQAPIHPAIIWADGRSKSQVAELLQLQREVDAVLPGNPAMGFAASSALWLKQHQPETLQQTVKWCLPKDYIRLKLTGVLATDPSDAAATWLYDISKEDWADEVLRYCGLQPSQMPTVVPSAAVSGRLTQHGADELGIPPDIPVAGSSADLPAQALGQALHHRNPC